MGSVEEEEEEEEDAIPDPRQHRRRTYLGPASQGASYSKTEGGTVCGGGGAEKVFWLSLDALAPTHNVLHNEKDAARIRVLCDVNIPLNSH